MRGVTAAAAVALTVALWPAPGAYAQAEARAVPTTFEYYYRIKWGSLNEFAALYEKNHKPLLDEMARQGFILGMQTEYPFTHLAGGVRWDMRVRIVYRDAATSINDPAWESAWVAAKEKLYTDLKKFDAEEARRFSLLEDHWDVLVSEYR